MTTTRDTVSPEYKIAARSSNLPIPFVVDHVDEATTERRRDPAGRRDGDVIFVRGHRGDSGA